MYKIYGFGQSFNTTKVLYCAQEAGAQFQFVSLDLSKGEHKTPENIARQPLGKTPSLEHNGRTLFESSAICKYIATNENSAMYPQNDHYQAAVVDQWVSYLTAHPGRWLSTLLFERVFRGRFNLGETNEDNVREALGFLEPQMQVIEDQLGRSEYLAGDQASIADCIAFAYLETKSMNQFSIDPYPRVAAWFERYDQRDATQQVHAMIR